MDDISLIPPSNAGLVHAALVYDGAAEFDEVVLEPVRAALALDLPILASVAPDRVAMMRDVVGPDTPSTRVLDMSQAGANPARMMSLSADFFARHSGRRGLFIGEPLYPGRTPAQIEEVRINEATVDVVFADAPITVLCPFDEGALGPSAAETAGAVHACVCHDGAATTTADFDAVALLADSIAAPLPPAPSDAAELRFSRELKDVRHFVQQLVEPLLGERTADLVLAVNEATSNTIEHARSEGVVRVWRDRDSVWCEVTDRGVLADPTVGRRMPDLDSENGRGLWMATQVCDLTQIRSSAGGTAVRLSMRV